MIQTNVNYMINIVAEEVAMEGATEGETAVAVDVEEIVVDNSNLEK